MSPDYSIGFQALAYADSALCFDEALVASSRLHSNGRSFVLKTGGTMSGMSSLREPEDEPSSTIIANRHASRPHVVP